MRHETRVKINGRWWRVRLVPASEMPRDALGDCDHPPGRHPTIRVRRNLRGKKLIEVIAHETIHACLASLDEQAVTDTGIAIGKVLFSLGYRKMPVQSKINSRSK